MAHVSEAKKKELVRITKLLKEAKNIGILDLTSLPSAQFQQIKSKLKSKMLVTVTKKALIRLALEKIKEEKKGIEELEKDLENCIPALLITEEDSFKIAKTLDNNKSSIAAKPGQTAPRDILIPAGPTEFPPGPIIGELGQAGIVASVEDGKIVVQQDSTIAKAGDILTVKQTGVLDKFGIEPMQIGLNLKSIYQDGQVFKSDVLSISEEEYIENLQNSVREALNLAVFVSYPTQETTEILLQKAEREALALSTKVPETKEETPTEEKPVEESQDNKEETPTEEKPVEESQDNKEETPTEQVEEKS
jgi:large subunit ribosomal protein L10